MIQGTLLVGLWLSVHAAWAQQPTTPPAGERKAVQAAAEDAPRTEDEAKGIPALERRIQISSGGVPVPFATVLNVNTAQAVAADANGVALVPVWGPLDTLKIQSLGFEELRVSPGGSSLKAVELQPALVEIEEVVVQSNADMVRLASAMSVESLAALPVRSPAVTAETTGDLLESSGQVALQMSQQGGISPVLRGFEANRVLLVVDGVRMNNAIYRSGHLQNAGSVDPFGVRRTDIILGPSSVMYGSDALGGVVHFLTPTPGFHDGGTAVDGRVVAQGSTANRGWAGHVKVATRSSSFGTVTQVTRREFGDLRMGAWRVHGDSTWGLVPTLVARIDGRDSVVANPDPQRQAPTGYEQWDVQQRMAWRLGATKVDANVQHSTTSNVPRFDVYNDVSGGNPKWAEWAYGPQRRSLAAVTVTRPVRGIQWNTVASVQRIDEERIKRRFGQTSRVSQLEQVEVWGLTSTAHGRWRNVRWEGGVDGQWNDVVSTATATDIETGATRPDLTRYADGGATMNNLGAFAAAQTTWRTQTLRAGLRASHARVHATFLDTTWLNLPVTEFDQAKGAVTGIASLEGRWTPALTGTTAVSSGFRHPNVDDLGKVREKNGYVLVPNADLRPEYLYTAEQGVTWELQPGSDLFTVNAAAFGSLWTDAIVQVNASLAGDTVMVVDGDSARIQMNQNVDRVWMRGARVAIHAKLWPSVRFRAVVNWTAAHVLDGAQTPVSHIPPTFGLAEVSRKGRVGVLSSSVRFALAKPLEAYGPDGTDNPQEALPTGSPGWAIWNVEGTVKLTEHLEARLSGINLLDLHYRTFGSGISAPGRNVRATVTVRF